MSRFSQRSARFFNRHPRMRWGVPIWLVAIVVALAGGMFSASAKTKPLAPRSAAQLLADVESSSVAGLSGTVVAKMSLGLPELPQLGGISTSGTLMSLLTGSHTARVWYAGATKQRVALIDPLGETDLFRDGADLWSWSSATRTATHTKLLAKGKDLPSAPTAITPEQLTARALAEIDPTTQVTTDADREIAGRAAYELVLTPRDPVTRVGSVRLAIDAQTRVPLAVEVYARGHNAKPALDVAFTQVTFAVPDDSNFAWAPPKGAVVTNDSGASARAGKALSAASQMPAVIGSGWTAVVATHANLTVGPKGNGATGAAAEAGLARMLDAMLKPQSGAWGTGRVFTSSLLSVLLTDDGRVLVGAVDPERLYAAALSYK